LSDGVGDDVVDGDDDDDDDDGVIEYKPLRKGV